VKSCVVTKYRITGGKLPFDGACGLYFQKNSDAECVGDEFLKIVLHTRLHGVITYKIGILIFRTFVFDTLTNPYRGKMCLPKDRFSPSSARSGKTRIKFQILKAAFQ
jgi:hypothetical protein